MWLLLAFVSATLLGLYDVVKKISLERNAVIPVLFLNIFFCCLLFLPVVLLSALAPDMMRNTLLFLPAIGSEGHFLLFFFETFAYYDCFTDQDYPAYSDFTGSFTCFWRTVEHLAMGRSFNCSNFLVFAFPFR